MILANLEGVLTLLDMMKNKRKYFVFFLLIFVTVIFISTKWISVSEVSISISEKELNRPFKIIHVTDLHNDQLFLNQNVLTDRIMIENPDVILITGDMISSSKGDGQAVFDWIESLDEKFPIYYSLGNHELYASIIRPSFYQSYMAKINDLGVTILDNQSALIDDYNIKLIGLSDIPYRLKIVNDSLESAKFSDSDIAASVGKAELKTINILLAHDPTYFEQYKNWGADLVLSGHIHGGAVRLPFIGGIISPNEKLFPKYDAGLYTEEQHFLYVSRGIGTSVERIRIFNRPELVIINIQ